MGVVSLSPTSFAVVNVELLPVSCGFGLEDEFQLDERVWFSNVAARRCASLIDEDQIVPSYFEVVVGVFQ